MLFVSEGRTGGEETSSEGFGFENDGDCACEDGEPTALSDMKARNFLGVVGVEVAAALAWSLLLRLMTLVSVFERPSMRRATPPSFFEGLRERRGGGASEVKENMSERSLTGWRTDGATWSVADDAGSAVDAGVWPRVEGFDGDGDGHPFRFAFKTIH